MPSIPNKLADLQISWSGAAFSNECRAFPRWAKRAAPLDGSLSWLTPLDNRLLQAMEPYFADGESRDQIATHFEKNVLAVQRRGFNVPEVFLKFMRSRELRRRVPSSAACYFDAPNDVVDMADGGVLFRFLNDSQWCALWYLYLGSDSTHAVVASTHAFDVPELNEPADLAHNPPKTWLCAPDFETFLFRFWLVNHIWFATKHEPRPLTPLERLYKDHMEARHNSTDFD